MRPGPRILFFTKGVALNPASRYRFLQYLPYLEDAGFLVTVRPLFPEAYYRLSPAGRPAARFLKKAGMSAAALLLRLAHMPEARTADLVVLENQLFPYEQGMLEHFLRLLNKNVIIEFDDAIYLTPLHRRKLCGTLRRAALVIVGNEHLAAFARRVAERVRVVPTVIDMRRYPERPPENENRRGRPFRIGWIGLPSTLPYLRRIEEALRRLAGEINLELRVISSTAPDFPGLPLRFIPWSENDEAGDLLELDVGVMPLPDNEWTRGKCGAKLLQYMAAGLPAVASPVGVNTSIVTHGENGLLAGTAEEWYRALKALSGEPDLRRRLGAAARRTVLKRYSLELWAPRVAEIYRAVIEGAELRYP